MQIKETMIFNCDKCGERVDPIIDSYFLLYNPILGTYHLCDICSLVLDQFSERVDKAIERRGKTMLRKLDA